MAGCVTVACIQNSPVPEVEPNLGDCEALVREAAAAGAELISLPEYFSSLDVDPSGRLLAPAFPEDKHPALPHFQNLARELGVWLNLGSLPISGAAGKAFNRGYLLDGRGDGLLSGVAALAL